MVYLIILLCALIAAGFLLGKERLRSLSNILLIAGLAAARRMKQALAAARKFLAEDHPRLRQARDLACICILIGWKYTLRFFTAAVNKVVLPALADIGRFLSWLFEKEKPTPELTPAVRQHGAQAAPAHELQETHAHEARPGILARLWLHLRWYTLGHRAERIGLLPLFRFIGTCVGGAAAVVVGTACALCVLAAALAFVWAIFRLTYHGTPPDVLEQWAQLFR